MKVERAAGALGAVVSDVDLRADDLDVVGLRTALLEHEVVFIRGADLSFDEHLALGHRFGTPSIHPIARILGATEPTMTTIEDGPDPPIVADAWHTDVTWTATPPSIAILHVEVPAEVGGDTLRASATSAVERLSPKVRDLNPLGRRMVVR